MLQDTIMLTEAQLIDTEWQENGIILHNCSGGITIEDLARTLLADLKDSRYAATTASLRRPDAGLKHPSAVADAAHTPDYPARDSGEQTREK